jgi:IS5 family transposase
LRPNETATLKPLGEQTQTIFISPQHLDRVAPAPAKNKDVSGEWLLLEDHLHLSAQATAHQIYTQQRHDKDKIYSVHEPEVECIAKGKADKKYEFGNKVSVAVSSRGGWFVGAKSFTGNPYDGHTLGAQMKQVDRLIGSKVNEAHVDMGYRGHDYEGAVAVHVDKRRRGKTPRALWRWMKRRAAVEPSIGHLKNEHRMERNRLKGVEGNAINAVLAAAAMNFQKLLGAFLRLFLRWLCCIWNELQLRQTPEYQNA